MMKVIKEKFVVIGKEGSTLDGEGFIQKLWNDANSNFSESDALTPVGGPGHHAVHGHISSPVIDSLIGDLHMRSSAPFGI